LALEAKKNSAQFLAETLGDSTSAPANKNSKEVTELRKSRTPASEEFPETFEETKVFARSEPP
jgi:hypothetical protein